MEPEVADYEGVGVSVDVVVVFVEGCLEGLEFSLLDGLDDEFAYKGDQGQKRNSKDQLRAKLSPEPPTIF